MGSLGFYLVFLIPPLVVGLGDPAPAEEDGRRADAGRRRERDDRRGGGADDPPAQRARGRSRASPSPGGPLSDHYDPRNRTVNLSQEVYDGRSVASVAIAAHEVGPRDPAPEGVRAVQGAQRDGAGRRLRLERLVLPASDRDLRADLGPRDRSRSSSSRVVVLFQLVTLPVEFDASRRAKQQLSSLGLVTVGRGGGREQGAQRRGADLRRGRARRPHAAPLPRRLPPLSGPPGAAARTCPESGRRRRRGRRSSSRCSSTGRRHPCRR